MFKNLKTKLKTRFTQTELTQKNSNQKGSVLRFILIVIAIILVLSYYNVSIEKFLSSPSVKENFGFVTDKVLYVWQNYLQRPVKAAFRFFVYYIWQPALDGLERMRNDQHPINQKLIPKITPP